MALAFSASTLFCATWLSIRATFESIFALVAVFLASASALLAVTWACSWVSRSFEAWSLVATTVLVLSIRILVALSLESASALFWATWLSIAMSFAFNWATSRSYLVSVSIKAWSWALFFSSKLVNVVVIVVVSVWSLSFVAALAFSASALFWAIIASCDWFLALTSLVLALPAITESCARFWAST